MNEIKNNGKTISTFLVPLFSLIYLIIIYITTGIRSDHITLVAIVNICYYISSATRRMITGLAIIIVYWIIFDSMKAWPNWAYNEVDIVPLYNLEKSLFGIHSGNEILTPNEFFIRHHTLSIDLVSSLFYLGWMPLPLIFAFYLYFKNKNLFLRFCMAFFVVNCIGFIIYYAHPAAPPWYYAEHGQVLDVTTKSYAAGLLRFDNYFGISLFKDLYSKGSNVFAAMPSMHASFPLIGLIYAFKQTAKWPRIMFGIAMIGIWFSAIYLTHHYVLDVLAGICCGLLGVLSLEIILMKNRTFGRFMEKYEKIISQPQDRRG